uniref:SCP domain-containing protein n=2 Tax=Strongyloides stercoralis TaxID=6248 RepID=A0A0K0E6K5_STRER
MWSKSSLFIIILFLFKCFMICSGFTYHIRQMSYNGKFFFIYNGKHYDTFQEVMAQVEKDKEKYYRRLERAWSTRKTITYWERPLYLKTTPYPPQPVDTVSRFIKQPGPIDRPFSRTPRPPKIIGMPSTRLPTTGKVISTSTAQPIVATQTPPENRIPRKYIPNPRAVDKLYTFDVDEEKLKDSSGPFSEKVYDDVWKDYDYKKDYKTGYLDMRDRILEETNRYREAHRVDPLTYDYDLEKAAQGYAKYLGDRNLFQHDKRNKQKGWGENLAKMSASLGSLATKKWYDEVKLYDFSKNQFSYGTGHFTALVWKGTKKVGCGIYMKREMLYVVCKYSPPGNMRNKFAENVFPRLDRY